MIQAWRIIKAKHVANAFTGAGAEEFGGRWNSQGVAVVYASGSISLATLEILVHVQSQELLSRYVRFEVTFDDALVTLVDLATLPKSWRKCPAPSLVQRIGDAWVTSGASAILRVPSVIVPSEWNYLLNPAHRDFGKIKIGPKLPVAFDPRLIKG